MGIINITPDSFSDGGDRLDPQRAIADGLQMVRDGADLVDVGGESTRPQSVPVPPAVEQARILPVIRALSAQGVIVSVDTRHASTMAAALEAGAALINDISGLADPDSAAVLARSHCPVVLMHMRGTPATMHEHAQYCDVVDEVVAELSARLAYAERSGIARGRIALDPGLGFAKTAGHNLALLQHLRAIRALGCPVLVGASRKRFIDRIAGVSSPKDRMPGSIAAALYAASQGARILRVHDVAETVQALRVWRNLAPA